MSSFLELKLKLQILQIVILAFGRLLHFELNDADMALTLLPPYSNWHCWSTKWRAKLLLQRLQRRSSWRLVMPMGNCGQSMSAPLKRCVSCSGALCEYILHRLRIRRSPLHQRCQHPHKTPICWFCLLRTSCVFYATWHPWLGQFLWQLSWRTKMSLFNRRILFFSMKLSLI